MKTVGRISLWKLEYKNPEIVKIRRNLIGKNKGNDENIEETKEN